MVTNIGILEEKAGILNLTYPCTQEEVKYAFRELAFLHHPDRGGDPKEFMKVKEAYDFLLPLSTESRTPHHQRTIEGTPLSDLGKGLGPTTNGTDCTHCQGKGYTIYTHFEYFYKIRCPDCNGTGWVNFHGTRLFEFSFRTRFTPCPTCLGQGGLGKKEVKKTLFHTCYHCKGAGQIEIFNPCLPKGRVITRVPNECKTLKKSYCPECGALLRSYKCWRCQKEVLSNTH